MTIGTNRTRAAAGLPRLSFPSMRFFNEVACGPQDYMLVSKKYHEAQKSGSITYRRTDEAREKAKFVATFLDAARKLQLKNGVFFYCGPKSVGNEAYTTLSSNDF
jgi:hypothetical protein